VLTGHHADILRPGTSPALCQCAPKEGNGRQGGEREALPPIFAHRIAFISCQGMLAADWKDARFGGPPTGTMQNLWRSCHKLTSGGVIPSVSALAIFTTIQRRCRRHGRLPGVILGWRECAIPGLRIETCGTRRDLQERHAVSVPFGPRTRIERGLLQPLCRPASSRPLTR
jgi:hypothetical protein